MNNSYRLDKTAFSIIDFRDQDPLENTRYWLTKTPQERWDAIEYLRQVAYGYDPTRTRLQRVFEITQRENR
jgi:hypothetical protein